MKKTALLALLLTTLALAGCAGPEGIAPSEVPGLESPSGPSTGATGRGQGALTGLVTDDELRPIHGATVRAQAPRAAESRVTDEGGAFRFDPLAAGQYLLSITHPDYEAKGTLALVHADAEARVDIHLVLLPSRRPYNLTHDWAGHYDCAQEFVIMTGDCLALYENVTGEADPVTVESNHAFFIASERWAQIVVELTWTPGSQNQLDGMHLYLAPADESRNPADHHTKFGIAEGNQQGLRVDLFPDVAHAAAEVRPDTGQRAILPAAGGEVMVLVYPRGQGAETAGEYCDPRDPSRCFLGAGAAVDLDFTVNVRVFYNEPAPADFTSLTSG